MLSMTALYVLQLGISDKLNLYIHPRYIIFTLVMSLLCLIVLGLSHYFTVEKDSHHSSKLLYIPLVFLLTSALLIPTKSLTSATVSQRSIDSGSIVSTQNSQPINTLFSGSSRGLKLADWSRLLATNSDPNYYLNRPAKISGFIYDPNLGTDTVWMARFVLTCCAVDAQPIGVPVYIENWRETYEEDQWIEAKGEFLLKQTTGGEILVLVPTTLNTIEQPRNPYGN